jgi:hypothetical protein
MTPATTSKTDKNFRYVSLLGLLGLAYALTHIKKAPVQKNDDDPIDTNYDTNSQVVVLQEDLILKSGSKGAEVKRLQVLMGITADGVFGPKTEASLVKLKNVKQISIKQFLNSPTINQNILPVGTKIMAKNKLGARIFNAIAKADTSYYSDNKIVETIAYGREVGEIRGVNPGGNYYSIYYKPMFSSILGTKVGFVLAVDVEKI